MSDLVFIAFPSEQKAEEVRDKVLAMQNDYLIELGDAVVPGRRNRASPLSARAPNGRWLHASRRDRTAAPPARNDARGHHENDRMGRWRSAR
jgi:hypothetical protein